MVAVVTTARTCWDLRRRSLYAQGVVGECPPFPFDVDDSDGRVLMTPNTWQQSSKSRATAAKLPAARIHGVSPLIWLQYLDCIPYCTGYQHVKGNSNGRANSKLAYSTKKYINWSLTLYLFKDVMFKSESDLLKITKNLKYFPFFTFILLLVYSFSLLDLFYIKKAI